MPEFWFMYLIPVVAIIAAVAYSQMARAQIGVAVATGQGPILFHNAFAKNFDLEHEEYIVAFWQGVVYVGSDEGTQGGVASVVSFFVAEDGIDNRRRPAVLVVLTSMGRVLLAEQQGGADSLVEVRDWEPGAGAEVYPDAMDRVVGGPILEPCNPAVLPQLTIISGPGDDPYPVWLSPQGGMVGKSTWQKITDVLPKNKDAAAQTWDEAMNAGRAQRA